MTDLTMPHLVSERLLAGVTIRGPSHFHDEFEKLALPEFHPHLILEAPAGPLAGTTVTLDMPDGPRDFPYVAK